MRLYGTRTSPFVRRVRVVAHELGQDLELVDTSTPEGQAALGRVTPLLKVPVLELGGVAVLDSHPICDLLLAQQGHDGDGLRRSGDRIGDSNLIHAIDGALESAIRLFYFQRDKVDVEPIPYMRVERDRVTRTLAWLEGQVRGQWCTPEAGFGLAELALVTTLEWIQFRAAAPLDAYPKLLALAAAHAQRPSLVATRPPT